MRYLKMKRFWWLSLIFISAPLWANRQSVPVQELRPTAEQQQTASVIVKVIEKYHYKDTALDDAMSEMILQRFYDSLDPNRSFFLAADIVHFSGYRDKLDDYLKNARIEPAFEIFRLYRQRVSEAIGHALKLLEGDFDFSIDESYVFEREELPWAQTRTELNDIWRRRVKNDFLNLRLMEKQDKEIKKNTQSTL